MPSPPPEPAPEPDPAPAAAPPAPAERAALDRDRVIAAAVELADAEGLAALTMNALGARLGVRGMSLYHHVAGKDAILDGMVDAVFDECAQPPAGGPWREGLRLRAASVRAALLRHPWAVGLLDSRRSPGPATLAHHDAVLACLRGAGFSVEGTMRAYTILDSYVYGFALQEVSLPLDPDGGFEGVADEVAAGMPDGAYPHLAEVAAVASRSGSAFGDAFAPGLEVVLDGLERLLAADRG